MAIAAADVERGRGWLDAVEAALVAQAMSQRQLGSLATDEANAGLAAVAAKFLAVGTPRTLGLVACGPLAAKVLAAQIAYAAPRELRVYEPVAVVADEIVAALGTPRLAARATALREACACDIVVVAGPVTIERAWIRNGTLVTVLDRAAVLEPALLAAAQVYVTDAGAPAGVRVHATLAAVAAGLVDGRQLDEITVLLPDGDAVTRELTVTEPRGPRTCDVVLLVATDTEEAELRAAATELGLASSEQTTPRLGRYLDLGVVGSDRVFAVRTRMGAIRHGGSAHIAVVFQLETQAAAMVQIGMAFGIAPDRQHLGDVLVGRAIIPYDERDIRDDGDNIVLDYKRLKRRRAKPALLAAFDRQVRRTTAATGYRVHAGALLSGSARIWSARFRDQLVRELPAGDDPIVGGEMEGVGLSAVSPADRPLWAIVKGISDFADADRDAIIETSRGPASRNAARFVLAALLHRGT